MMHIAVIGSGISGLAASYLLSRQHRVTLIESETRLGGHTHTVRPGGPHGPLALDTGFLVHNHRTYPHLVRLFHEIGVETQLSDMSFSVTCEQRQLSYSSRGLAGFFAERHRLTSLDHCRLLWQIVRFNRRAPRVLEHESADTRTLAGYLHDEGFGAAFAELYLLPMTSAIWSASTADIGTFPVATVVRFLHNHGMLSTGTHPAWYVVRGGSDTYIPRLIASVGSVELGARVLSVARCASSVTLTMADRPAISCDHVVFACPGDRVLPLLADPSDRERDVLAGFSTTANDAWLHTDRSFLPAVPAARASWNYRLGESGAAPHVTYHLNRLQGIASDVDYCVTLNPTEPPRPADVIRRIACRHPKLDRAAMLAQRGWSDVSGIQRTHYCGAYWRYGFHEDGLWSAMRVARSLGVEW